MDLSEMKSFDTPEYEYDRAHREMSADEQQNPCTCQRKARERMLREVSPSMVGYPSLIQREDADPDCELHFPWQIEDDLERVHAMRWWAAGYQVGYDTGNKTGQNIVVERMMNLLKTEEE